MPSASDPVSTPVPDVSLCIATHNARESLRACLTSIRDGCWTATYEVLVTDNASADGTAAMLAADFPAVVALRSETNLMFGAGINHAARQARGRHLVVLNDDTVLTAEAIEALIGFLDAHPEVGVCGPRLVRPNGKPERAVQFFPSLRTELARCCGLLGLLRRRVEQGPRFVTEWVTGSCFAVNGALGRELGFFDEGYRFYWEDVDLCYRVRQHGRQVWVLGDVTVIHAHAQTSRGLPKRERLALVEAGRRRFLERFDIPCRGAILALDHCRNELQLLLAAGGQALRRKRA